MKSVFEKGDTADSTDKNKRAPKTSAADKRKFRQLKLAVRVVGIFAIVIFIVTVFLIALNGYIHLTKTAPYLFYIMFALMGVSVVVWLVLFLFSGGLKNGGAGAVKEKEDAAARGEIWCTQEQVDEIGKVFDKDIVNCPVCGAKIEDSNDYNLTTNVLVRRKIEGVYVARNYSPQVEQAYEIVTEEKTFPNVRRCACPKCRWEAFYGIYKSYSSDYPSGTVVCKQLRMGKLYSKRKLPSNMSKIDCIFEKKK
ncbi:MAG: hypothetical protein NC033_03330 [Clostridiales bacterium]|nr:hypothetical protein [Clostridiales bacterium]